MCGERIEKRQTEEIEVYDARQRSLIESESVKRDGKKMKKSERAREGDRVSERESERDERARFCSDVDVLWGIPGFMLMRSS